LFEELAPSADQSQIRVFKPTGITLSIVSAAFLRSKRALWLAAGFDFDADATDEPETAVLLRL
jgi:hypothetical protein